MHFEVEFFGELILFDGVHHLWLHMHRELLDVICYPILLNNHRCYGRLTASIVGAIHAACVHVLLILIGSQPEEL